jgi:hypothetical protein
MSNVVFSTPHPHPPPLNLASTSEEEVKNMKGREREGGREKYR